MASGREALSMSRAPAVACSGCGFTWNSATMAEGLRLLGSCPKCDGTLVFRAKTQHEPEGAPAAPAAATIEAPHLVLGIPRR